jgi:hypothetical protein
LGGVFEICIMTYGVILFKISDHSFTMYAIKKLFLASTSDESLLAPPAAAKRGKVYKNQKLTAQSSTDKHIATKHRQIKISPWKSV